MSGNPISISATSGFSVRISSTAAGGRRALRDDHVEDLRQQLVRNAGAVVDHPSVALPAIGAPLDAHRSAGLGVLRGVVQQVANALHEPYGIAVDGRVVTLELDH